MRVRARHLDSFRSSRRIQRDLALKNIWQANRVAAEPSYLTVSAATLYSLEGGVRGRREEGGGGRRVSKTPAIAMLVWMAPQEEKRLKKGWE